MKPWRNLRGFFFGRHFMFNLKKVTFAFSKRQDHSCKIDGLK
jgi:hypothetical protein